MTEWLADASALLAAVDALDPEHEGATRLLAGTDGVATLDLAYYEVANVAVRAWRSPRQAAMVRAVVTAIAHGDGLVRVDDSLVSQAGALADQHGLSVYDAAYVAAARRLGAGLVSCDLRDLVAPGLAVTPRTALSDR